jgi:hypothetical protein
VVDLMVSVSVCIGDQGGCLYSALEISPMLNPLGSVVVVAATVTVSRRWGSTANADAARARIMLVSFIVIRNVVRMER